jgi:hypothetical protein
MNLQNPWTCRAGKNMDALTYQLDQSVLAFAGLTPVTHTTAHPFDLFAALVCS